LEVFTKGIAKVMGRYFLSFIVFLFLIFSQHSYARVFMFDEESVAPYLNMRAGVTSMGSTPYAWQTTSAYTGDEIDLVYGGEFGIYFRGGSFGVGLGVLVQTFDPVTGGKGENISGTQLFSVDVEGLAYGPQITFDYQFASTDLYMWKLIFGGGYQFAKIESTYSFTATGQTLNGGQASLTESYKQDSAFAMLGLSTEFIMSGTTTLTVTAGYHYSLSKEWEYGQGGENFAGSHLQGGKVSFEDASVKPIDWSYAFIQLGFQFYVDTVR